MVKRKTAGEEIRALKARIAELEKAAEDEAKVFLASIREALRAAKVEAPGEAAVTITFNEAGPDFTVSYKATGARTPRHSNGERDPRLPAPGTKIVKTHKDRDHEVVFTDDNSAEMDGKRSSQGLDRYGHKRLRVFWIEVALPKPTDGNRQFRLPSVSGHWWPATAAWRGFGSTNGQRYGRAGTRQKRPAMAPASGICCVEYSSGSFLL
jgi:hypothetical protein